METSSITEQEWTHEKLQGLLRISNEDRYVADEAFEDTLDEINSAFAAERQRREQAEGAQRHMEACRRKSLVKALEDLQPITPHDAAKSYMCSAYCPACKIDAALAQVEEKT